MLILFQILYFRNLILICSLCHCVLFVIAFPLSFWRRKNLNRKCYETLPTSEWQKCVFYVTYVFEILFSICSFIITYHLSFRTLCNYFPFVITFHLSFRFICHSVPFVIAFSLSFWRRKNLNCYFIKRLLRSSQWQKCGFLILVYLKSYFHLLTYNSELFVIGFYLSMRSLCHCEPIVILT